MSLADWETVRDLTKEFKKTDFCRELLSLAESYAATGKRRLAVIEAVTALEIAISKFITSDSGKARLARRSENRATKFSDALLDLGKTGMLEIVLPLLFDETEISADLLGKCLAANRKRNALVHGKQIDVKAVELREYLPALRELVGVLVKASKEEIPSDHC